MNKIVCEPNYRAKVRINNFQYFFSLFIFLFAPKSTNNLTNSKWDSKIIRKNK